MSSEDNVNKHSGIAGTHIKISSRGKNWVIIVVKAGWTTC
jgi:hypothetical protein